MVKEMIAEVIPGERKFVNAEFPHAIADLFCQWRCNYWSAQLQVPQLGLCEAGVIEVIEQMRRGAR